MTERPILFSAPMVRAILDSRKTQTRRIVKPQPEDCSVRHQGMGHEAAPTEFFDLGGIRGPRGEWACRTCGAGVRLTKRDASGIKCPYGKPGDRLWVRETYSIQSVDSRSTSVAYRERMPRGKTLADTDGGLDVIDLSTDELIQADRLRDPERWRPSIHMPRWASRIKLEIAEVRVERLQSISAEDISAEGVETVGEAMWGPRWWVQAPEKAIEDARTRFASLRESINGKNSWGLNPWVWCVGFKVVANA